MYSFFIAALASNSPLPLCIKRKQILCYIAEEEFLVVMNVRGLMLNYLNYHVVIKMFQTETLTEFFPQV